MFYVSVFIVADYVEKKPVVYAVNAVKESKTHQTFQNDGQFGVL